MSYFDDVIEPALLKEPSHLHSRIVKEVEDELFSIPTDARNVPWHGANGKTTIGQMDDSHLFNAHNLLGKRIGTKKQKEADHVFYGFLRAEINRRNFQDD